MPNIRIKDIPTTASATSSNDFIAIDGATNGTRKLSANSPVFAGNVTAPDYILGTSGPSVRSSLGAKAPRQGLVFDGTAKIPFSLGAFGTNPATIHFWFNPATFTGNPRLLGAGSAIQILLDAAGAQFFTSGGSVFGSALTLGKTTAVTVVINGNGTALIYTNGVAGTSGAITANLSTAIDTIGGLASGNIFSGVLSPLIYNRALSATEIVSLYESGAPSGVDYNNASNTSLITGDNSTFASNTGYWTLNGTASISGGKATIPNSASYMRRAGLMNKGGRYRYSVTVLANAASIFRIQNGDQVLVNVTASGGTGTFTGEFTNTTSGNAAILDLYSSSGSIEIDDLTLTPLGLLLAPDAQQNGGGLVWYDTSGNAANITLPASGVRWSNPFAGFITAPTTTNLTLAGGSSGASLVLGQGASGAATISTPGAGFLSFTKSEDALTPSLARFLNAGATTAGRYNEIIFGRNLLAGGAGTIGYKSDTGTPANGRLFLVNYGSNQDTGGLQVTYGGNVLLGTTTDSANGRLQLATHTTSAGGIGFGTDVALYRSGVGVIATDRALSALGDAAGVSLYIPGGRAIRNDGIQYLDATTSFIFRTASFATALTLDSSQNATFAGKITAAGVFDFSVNANSTQVFTIQNGSTGAAARTRLTFVGGASSANIELFGSGHTTPNIVQYASPASHKFLCNGVARLDLDVSGNLTTGGAVTTSAPTGGAGAWELGVANTVTPTAPNRTITIEIGGTVYYLHAKTTND